VHNESYRSGGGVLSSAVGVTSYLDPGNHSVVEVPLLDGTVEEDQQLIVVPYRDTNRNQRYDYIASDGFQDTAYENRTGSRPVIVNDTAQVVVSNSARETATAMPASTT